MDIGKELKRIEREERAIENEENQIEQKEDLLRVFEELGLMRWKSYYILTAGAILLLSITFVTSLWVMHDQMVTLQASVDALSIKLDAASIGQSACETGQTLRLSDGTSAIITGSVVQSGSLVCTAQLT